MAVLIHQPYNKTVIIGEGGIDTSDATATAADIKSGLTAYVNNEKITGSAYTINQEVSITPSTDDHYLVSGFYNGIAIPGDEDLVAENIKEGVEIFGITGTLVEKGENDIDTTDATATADDILLNKTAYVNGEKLTGTILSQEEQTIVPSTIDKTISSGIYIAGKQTIKGDEDLIAENIKAGVSIFDVDGTFTSDGNITEYDIPEGKIGYANGEKIIGTALTIEDELIITPTTYPFYVEEGTFVQTGITVKGSENLLAENIKEGVEIFDVVGTYSPEVSIEITDATATSADILEGKIAYNNDGKVIGTMASLEETIYTPTTSNLVIDSGVYLAGDQIIEGDENLVADNIKSGITIFGITGTYEGSGGESEESSELVLFDSVDSTSTDDIVNKYSDSIYVFSDSKDDFTPIQAYDYNDTTPNVIYNSSYGAGINMNKLSIGAGFINDTPITIKKSTALLKRMHYVSTWINPTVTLSLIEASSFAEAQEKVANSDYTITTTITLANVNNNAYSFTQLENLPVGTFYPVVQCAEKAAGNEALIKYLGLIFI